MNKIELNDNYVTKIITGTSTVLMLAHKEDLGDSRLEIVIKDQADEYFQGIVVQNDENEYVIEGDSEFERVYPSIDSKTGKIVKITKSEDYPPKES